jgi:hypothetical protein
MMLITVLSETWKFIDLFGNAGRCLRSTKAKIHFRRAFELAPSDLASLYSPVSFYLSAKAFSAVDSSESPLPTESALGSYIW